ncbi:hypothetical protein ACFV16_22455 [Streptomyces massasporeus]|uniref:hypothetical protein n=1 Tax=Streptomyces massasporeus TaxID=67324 RepID=UPI0036A46ED4
MNAGKPRLRGTDTRDARWAVATFEVLVGDSVLGTVTKYDMPSERNAGSRQRPHYEPQRVVRWTADVYGTEDDELHQRRKDAVDLLAHVHRTETG